MRLGSWPSTLSSEDDFVSRIPLNAHAPALNAVEAAAQRLGVQVLTVPVRRPEDLDGAFTMMVRERVPAWRGNCGSPSRRSAIGTVGFWPHASAGCSMNPGPGPAEDRRRGGRSRGDADAGEHTA